MNAALPVTSAASEHAARDLTPILVPSLILVAIILISWGVLVAVRRTVRSNASTHGAAFTLQDLRRLRDQGALSEEEFERARQTLLTSNDRNGPANSA